MDAEIRRTFSEGPVIVDGRCLLDVLARLGLETDVLIYMNRVS